MGADLKAEIQAIASALTESQSRRALDLVVGIWRQARHPLIADVADKLAQGIEAEQKPPRTKKEFHRYWIELATSAPSSSTAAWLALSVADMVEVRAESYAYGADYGLRKYAVILERLEALAALPANPCVASGLIEMIARRDYSVLGDFFPVHEAALRIVEQIGDIRGADRLVALAKTPTAKHRGLRQWLTVHARAAAEQVRSCAQTTVSDSEVEGFRAFLPTQPASSRRNASELLDAIRNQPDEFEHRAIYADFLQELGDVRGEFIALQLSKNRANCKRAARLWKEHKSKWLGPELDRFLAGPEAVDGFLHTTGLAANSVGAQSEWERASLDERLATLHTLRKGRSNNSHLQRFATSGAAKNLRVIELVTRAMLLGLVEMSAPPPLVEIDFWLRPRSSDLKLMVDRFPSLRSLILRGPAKWDVIDGADVLTQIDFLRFVDDPGDAFERWSAGALKSLCCGREHYGVEVHRRNDQVVVAVKGQTEAVARKALPFLETVNILELWTSPTTSRTRPSFNKQWADHVASLTEAFQSVHPKVAIEVRELD